MAEATEPIADELGSATMRRYSPRAVLLTVGFSVFVAADDLTVVSTMLRPIIGDLGLVLPDGLDDAAWIVNAYLIAFVAVMPVAGRVSDLIGRRRTFVGAYLLFLVGTIVIPLTSSMGPFIVGRVLTAIGGGAMVPVALAVVGDAYPERERARALGTLGAIETLGWVWGPLYGALLVRFLTWRWQFWLNVPLAIIGLVASWRVLAAHDRPPVARPIDWLGAASATVALVSLNLALLGSAEIQSVSGLDQLTGGGPDLRWLYIVAAIAGGVFVVHQRRATNPLIDRRLLAGRTVRIALIVNFIVGAALVIAMVDVPIFINTVEVDIERSAVVAGAVLAAMTAAMAVTSYVGGRWTERAWACPPVVAGLGAAAFAYVVMGLTWEVDTSYWAIAVQLAFLGAGLGLTVAPTTSAVVAASPSDQRGAAAAVVMVVRLLGLSVGLSALTAWGLARFNRLRGTIELPSLTDPGFEAALLDAQQELTAKALTETFLATAVITGAGALLALAWKRRDHRYEMADLLGGAMANEEPTNTVEPVPSVASVSSGAPTETSWLHRHLGVAFGVLAVGLLGALLLCGVLFARLGETRDELTATQADLERVEGGAALFAAQVQGFQEQLTAVSPTITAGLDDAIEGIETFGESTLTFTVSVDEEVPIGTTVVIDRTIDIPIATTIPIQDEFDTTIRIDGPLGTSIPLDVTVPVDIEVPVNLDLSLPINESVPIETNVPIALDVPIEIDISETELADLSRALADGLRSFQEILGELG